MTSSARPTFTFLGHSTIRCDLPGGEVVLIEPWVDQNPTCPDHLKSFDRIDAMLITHGHPDHMADAVSLAKRYRPQVVVANYEIRVWLGSKGVENCSGMNIGGTQSILNGAMDVSQVQALHTSTIFDGDQAIGGGVATGFVMKLENGYTFYHSGDTGLFSDMSLIADLYSPSTAFLPIGDHFTMDPRQAALACKFLAVQDVVPIHWGTFPTLSGSPEQLEQEVADLGLDCRVLPLSPGESWTPDA